MKNQESLQSINKLVRFCFLLLLLGGCSKKETRQFELRTTNESGIAFENTLTENDELNILDYLYFYNGGGVAMGDINNDGLPDLYFSANQKKNKLYLNKGGLKFEDITQKAGVGGQSSWNTGTIMGDINGDGWLDIYVVAVVGINGFIGHNELFINNQDGTFTEQAETYGLDFTSFGTTAALLDFDLDGDLDLYLLNHAVHTEESFGRAQIRNERNAQTGDRLLRNDGNTFTDVSDAAGIYGGINGYGLGVAVSDFNQDGFPDIYVGNDFHEDDYYYLNNGDGTFSERLQDYFGHTSRFSMGNDVGDVNNDGLPDIISLDMAPEDEKVLKSSEGDDTYQTLKMRTDQFGYHYQYTRNMLFINNGDHPYTETALQSGISATDWSWSALFGDYDQDGLQDLFISNGIPRRPNDLDFIRFVSSEEIQKKMVASKLVDQQALEMMPSGAMHNYIFKGDGRGSFTNLTEDWIGLNQTVSGATAIGDLDGDGDLDLVVNNINAPVGMYVNQINTKANYLKIGFQYTDKNPFGIGTKVYAYKNDSLQFRELYPTKGWQASSDPTLHFGWGAAKQLDSVKIIWPNQTFQIVRNVPTNQTLLLKPENTKKYNYTKSSNETLFRKTKDNLGIDFVHKEDNHTDFNYQKLIPYEVSAKGPAVAIGDLNSDGKDDLFLGGAKNQKAAIYLQTESGYEKGNFPGIEKDAVFEDISAGIVKSEATNRSFLSVLSGGNRVSPSKKYLVNRWYQSINDTMVSRDFGDSYFNSSVIKVNPENAPGYSGLIGNHTAPLDFGKLPPFYFLKDDGNHEFYPEFGMVTDAVWDDFNGDGLTDAIIVGEWMSPRFFQNDGSTLREVKPLENKIHGLWQTIIPFDIDGDGDRDYLLGNWGTNTKFKASQQAPMKMYYGDFDDNGSTETILAIEKNGSYFPLLGLNELAEQLVFLRKKFPNYKDFAGKTIEAVFGTEMLSKATVFEVNTLTSGFLRNNENTFIFEEFPRELQTAPITAFAAYDFNGNGKESVLVGGNYFGVIPFHGRFDSFSGALITSEDNITLGHQLGLTMEYKSVRHLKIIQANNQPYLLIVYNNEAAEIYEIQK